MRDTPLQCETCNRVVNSEWVQIIVKDASGYTVGFFCHEHLLDYAASVGAEQMLIDQETDDE